MSGWWDGFTALLFKRAVLLKEDTEDLVSRYLAYVRRVTAGLLWPLVLLLVGFAVCIAVGIQSPWVYQTLILLMAGVILAIIIIALPLLVLSETVYKLLPQRLQEILVAWQRRGAAILFGALLAVVVIRIYRLWESPGTMLNVLLILAVLWLGGYFGWLKVSDAWRKVLALKLQITLIVIAVAAVLPGPAGLIEDLANWTGNGVQAAVFRVTRSKPERWNPASADELRFVDEGTGQFLVWYYRDDRGDYHLFKSKGYDNLGRPLKLAETVDEFTAIREWQRGRDLEREQARRAKEEEAAWKREEERIAAAEREAELARIQEQERIAEAERAAERAKEAERLRLSSYVVALPKARVDYIVFFVDSGGKPSSEVTSAVVNCLTKKGFSAAGDVFSHAFISPQGFDAVAAGRGAGDVVAMQLGEIADGLLLIGGSDAESTLSSSVSGLQVYSMRMTISLIAATDGRKFREFVISDITGAGLSEVAARTAFIERFAEAVAAREELVVGLR